MAVEKMVMMNVNRGYFSVDDVLKDIALSSKVDLVSAMREIEENNMLININHENLERVIDLNDIKSFSKDTSYRQLIQKQKKLIKLLILILENSLDGVFLDKDHVRGKIDEIYEQVQHYNENQTGGR